MTDQIAVANETIVASTSENQATQADGIPQRVATADIIPDPNQPRKTFEEMPMEELVATVKIWGIMQSLLLRIKGDKYMIIHGERRWRAATEAGLPDVPAMIIEATDEEALAMQLIENLQRENVPVMEQAAKFRQMAEQCHLNPAEIAAAVGKSEYFIRQQIKLTDLTPKWQAILTKQGITVKIALQIAVFPANVQKLIYENQVSKEDENAEHPVINLNTYILTKYSGLLSQAVFDTTDSTLDTKMGSCITCPFNSGCYSLFPGEDKHPQCSNIACFNNKTSIHIKREFQKAKEDPAIVFVFESYSGIPDEVKTLKEEGLEVFKMGYSDDCTQIVEPVKRSPEEYQEWAKRYGMKKGEIKQGYTKAVKKYEADKSVYDKHVASGRYKKAFIVYDSSDKSTGKYTYVQMNEKKTKNAQANQKKIASGKGTLDDINQERTRLQEWSTRKKQRDAEIVHKKIVDALRDSKNFNGSLPKAPSRVDSSLLLFLLFDNMGLPSVRSKIEKIVKLPSFTFSTADKFLKALEALPKQQVSFVLHQVFLNKYGNFLPGSKEAFMVRKMAESLGSVPIATFEKEQKGEADKRQQRLNEKFSALNEEEKKIKASSKKTPVKQLPSDQKQSAA
jgi:ParB family transcriptional regulator, chromosome partitioning protein